jgi:hypothetical protein
MFEWSEQLAIDLLDPDLLITVQMVKGAGIEEPPCFSVTLGNRHT